MPETTVPVSEETEVRLSQIAERTGRSVADVVQDAVEAYEARLFFAEMDEAYQVLESDFREWNTYMADLLAWIDAEDPQEVEEASDLRRDQPRATYPKHTPVMTNGE